MVSPFHRPPAMRLSMLAARLLQGPSSSGTTAKAAKKAQAAEPAERRSRGRRLSKPAARDASSSSDAWYLRQHGAKRVGLSAPE